MPRIVRSGAFLCGGRKLLRFHTFKRHVQLNIVGRWAQVHLLAEVLAIEAGGAFKAGTVAAPWIFAFTQEGGLDNDRLGHAVQGQVAGHVGSDLARSIFTGGFNTGGHELGIGKLANVQEVFAGDVLVTFGVVGEHAGGTDVELNLAVFRLGSIEAELAVKVLEGTGDEAVAQVADLEVNEGVLAFLVDNIVRSHRLTGNKQCRTDCQSGESLFQHAFYSL